MRSPRGNRVGEAGSREIDTFELREGRQLREIGLELVGRDDAARRVYAREHRVNSGGREHRGGFCYVAADDFHYVSSRAAAKSGARS